MFGPERLIYRQVREPAPAELSWQRNIRVLSEALSAARGSVMKKKLLLTASAFVVFAASAQADPLKLAPVAITPSDDTLSPGLAQVPVAEGAFKLENPSKYLAYYGYGSDGPLKPAKGAVQAKGKNVEATKTEPDKNTYLVLEGATGPHKGYNYGTHFLFQGHENGPVDEKGVDRGGLTRINLDADKLHRVTLMADTDTDGKPLPLIDGSAWDPFAKVLLLTSEEGADGGVWAATVDFPSKVVEPLRSSRATLPTKACRSTPMATSGWSRTPAARAAT